MELKCSQVGHNPSFERHTECSRISRSARRRLSRKSRKTCKSHAQFSNSQYGSNSDLGPIRQQGPIQPAIWTDRSQSMQNLTSPFTENTNGSGRGNFRSSGQSEQRNNDAGQQSDQQAFTRSRQVSNQEARSRFNIPITGLSSQGGTQAPKGYDDMNSSDWQDSGSALQGDSKTTWRGFWNGKGPEPKKRFKARSLWGRNFSKDKATPKQTPEDDWAGVEQQVPEDDDGWGTSPDAKIQAKSQQKSDEKQIKGKIANSNAINEFQDTPASREPLEAAVQDEFRSSTARFRGDTEARESLTGVDDKVSQEDQPNIPGKKSERNWYVVSDQPSRGKSAQGSEPRESSQNESQNVPVNGNFSPFVSEQTVNGRAESRIGELEPEIMEDAESGWDEIEVDWQDGTGPDITLLSPSEADELLPVVPTAEQMGYAWGNAVDLWQRLGSAAFVTIITVKLNLILIASGAASYPFWGPLLTAANRNRAIRSTGRHVGFWRTRVLEMNVERPQRRRYTGQTSSPVAITRPTIRFLLGDDSGARSSLSLPLNKRYESIQIGEPAEAIVLSSKSGFSTFKALREVYFPESGLWMSEYPHVNRNLFLDISLDIERARRQEMMEGTLDALV